jgi:hypothetical protein
MIPTNTQGMPSDRQAGVQLFESTHIRSHWDAELEEWFFSIVDVVAALTESVNPTDYLKKLRKRDDQLRDYIGTNCPQVAMPTETGKARKTLAATTQQLLRIVQSIPSKKAEPFKLWLAKVRVQLQMLNNVQFADAEWQRFVESWLDKGSDGIVEKTRKIHDDYIHDFVFDDGRIQNIYLLDKQTIARNKLQVIKQFEQTGSQAKPLRRDHIGQRPAAGA